MKRLGFYFDQLVNEIDLEQLFQSNIEEALGLNIKDIVGTGLSSTDVLAYENAVPDMIVKIPIGSAYAIEERTLNILGDLTIASPTIANVKQEDVEGQPLGVNGLKIGQVITHANIPAGSTIIDIDQLTNDVTISNNATGTEVGAQIDVTIQLVTRVHWEKIQDIDASQDWTSSPTIPLPGKERYIACYVKQKRYESDERLDGYAANIWYRQDEGFEFRIYAGAEADPGTAVKVVKPGDEFELVFEVLIDENTTSITNPVMSHHPAKDEIDILDVVYCRSQELKNALSFGNYLSLSEKLNAERIGVLLYNVTLDVGLVENDCVRYDTVASKWKIADFTNVPSGILVDKEEGTVLFIGGYFDLHTPVPVGTLYMDASGKLTTTQTEVKVGFASTVNNIFFNPANYEDFSIAISKYRHLIERKGKWFDINFELNRVLSKNDITNHPIARAVINNTENGRLALVDSNGRIDTYLVNYDAPPEPINPTFPSTENIQLTPTGTINDGIMVQDTSGNLYYVCVDYHITTGGVILRCVNLDGSGDLLAIGNTVSRAGKRYAYGVTQYNGNLYVSFNENNVTRGRTVDKISIDDAVAGTANWTNVLDATANSVNFEYIGVDTATGIFYLWDELGNIFYTFLDDGNQLNFNSQLITGVTSVTNLKVIESSIYIFNDNDYMRRYQAFSAYTNAIDIPVQYNIEGYAEPVQASHYFDIFKKNNKIVIAGTNTLNDLRIYYVNHQLNLLQKIPDSDITTKFTGVIIDEKAHIIKNDWKIVSEFNGIDTINEIAGVVDDIGDVVPNSWYFLWAFADADNIFKGFGLTRQPRAYSDIAEAGGMDTSKIVGETYQLKLTHFSNQSLFASDFRFSNPLSHFTQGAKVQLYYNTLYSQLVEISNFNFTNNTCDAKVLANTTVGGTYSVEVFQLDNFKPFKNGLTQELYQPKFKLISKCIRILADGNINIMNWKDGLVMITKETMHNGTGIHTKSVLTQYPPNVLASFHCYINLVTDGISILTMYDVITRVDIAYGIGYTTSNPYYANDHSLLFHPKYGFVKWQGNNAATYLQTGTYIDD